MTQVDRRNRTKFHRTLHTFPSTPPHSPTPAKLQEGIHQPRMLNYSIILAAFKTRAARKSPPKKRIVLFRLLGHFLNLSWILVGHVIVLQLNSSSLTRTPPSKNRGKHIIIRHLLLTVHFQAGRLLLDFSQWPPGSHSHPRLRPDATSEINTNTNHPLSPTTHTKLPCFDGEKRGGVDWKRTCAC